MEKEFQEFLTSDWELEIWSGGKIIFQSRERQVKGLLSFIGQFGQRFSDLIVFDRKVGNAVSLLCVYLKVKEAFGEVGSELAEKTLEKYGIKFYFQKIIPNILNEGGSELCPLEKLSLNKTAEDFLASLTKK